MRRLGAALALLALAAIVAGSAGGAASGTATVKIPLPPPNTARFVQLSVKSGGPFKVSAANAKQLGSSATNAQVVVARRTAGKGTYDLVVVIHRFASFKNRRLPAAARGDDVIDLIVSAATNPKYQMINGNVSCGQLLRWGYLDDTTFGRSGWSVPDNIVPSNDTSPEEQMDNAGYAKCPATAEKDDPGSK